MEKKIKYASENLFMLKEYRLRFLGMTSEQLEQIKFLLQEIEMEKKKEEREGYSA